MQTEIHSDQEGGLTRSIEVQTSKAPSISYLTLAVGSMIASAGLAFAGRRELANFVGLWVPSILVIGLYNKLVKVEKELGATYH
ncbi:MAG TPA: hypothetical protein VFV50_02450 [Bdellovibrionales bacterium]|nr:hypothetical protein [Bdellovibrionales bacterium]